MYRPRAFAVDDPDAIAAFVDAHPFAILVGPGEHVTHLPLLRDPDGGLSGHLARANPHAAALQPGAEALAIFTGPHGYVSPTWYAAERAVPTWNYATAHLRLRVTARPDGADAAGMLRGMVARMDDRTGIEDRVTDEVIDAMAGGVVAVRFENLDTQGLFKMSQNRSPADRQGVLAGLAASGSPGDRELAAFMRRVNRDEDTPVRPGTRAEADAEAIIGFWFGELAGGLCSDATRKRLFGGGADFDGDIRTRFGAAVAAALAGELDHWAATARGRLALVLLLDQFTRNIHRGTAEAFAGDRQALEFAREGVGRGDDLMLTTELRVFLYLPFEHSESLSDQDTCVTLLNHLMREVREDPRARAVVEHYLGHAREHRDIVCRFGRFPHRNASLSRPSTPEEDVWLASGGRRFGQ